MSQILFQWIFVVEVLNGVEEAIPFQAENFEDAYSSLMTHLKTIPDGECRQVKQVMSYYWEPAEEDR